MQTLCKNDFPVSAESSAKPIGMRAVAEPNSSSLQLPVSSYFDEALYRREMQSIFQQGPRYVGHTLSVPHVGDYYALPQEQEGRALVRNASGVELISNVCRHRQALMLKGRDSLINPVTDFGRQVASAGGNIVCPLHRWTYSGANTQGMPQPAGTLIGAPHFNQDPCLNLKNYPLQEWNGLLFEQNGRDVAVDLAGMGPRAALDFEGFVLDKVVMHECNYNWKTFIEVYLEDYHVGPFHPGLGQTFGHTYGLHRVVFLEFPAQVVTGHKLAQTRVEGPYVVVLQVDLDKSFPVVVALVHFHMVQHKSIKTQGIARAHAGKVCGHIAAVAFKQEAVPFLQGVVVQVEAGVGSKVGRADKLAGGQAALMIASAVSPAVQGANDIAAGAARAMEQGALAFEHDRLAVATNVGDELNTLRITHQGTAFLLLRQRVVVTDFGHAQCMAYLARSRFEKALHLAREQRRIKVA